MLRKVRIRNFRSISDLTIDLTSMNILIGKNDTGKSNILRALNLFFNGEADFREQYNFRRDFSTHAKTGKGKAQEIRIDLTLDLPDGYQAPEAAHGVEWTRRWRSSGIVEDEPRFLLTGNRASPIGGRSKIKAYLANIDYHYIPALKGRDYFSEIMADIYDVLSEVSEDELLGASNPLQEQVAKTLSEVSEEIGGFLESDSSPRLPSSFRSIFKLIQFESNGIDLNRRGDGIRVRHVPSLIKFLCELKSRRAGHFKSHHIWGLEEPENSVDFIAAFELKEQVHEISSRRGYQILMSTHSPIFFQMEEEDDANTLFFSKRNGETEISEFEGDISDEMGVLRVVSPYVSKSRERITELQSDLDSLRSKLDGGVLDPQQKFIFVEGRTDVDILRRAASLHPFMREVKILCEVDGANSSASAVVSNTVAWHYLQKSRKEDKRVVGVGLVDGDEAGQKAVEDFNMRLALEKDRHARLVKLSPTDELRKKILKIGFKPHLTIEAFAPLSCWVDAREKGWLVEKPAERILGLCAKELKKRS